MPRTNTGVLFYLKNPKKQISPVKCVFCFSGYQLYYYEKKLSIETKFWNKNSQRVKENKSVPGFFDFNITLDNIESSILSSYRKFINDTGRQPEIDELRILIKQRRGIIKVKSGPELIEFIDAFIKQAESGKHINLQTGKAVCKSTIHTYKQTFFLLKEFAKAKKW